MNLRGDGPFPGFSYVRAQCVPGPSGWDAEMKESVRGTETRARGPALPRALSAGTEAAARGDRRKKGSGW